MGNDEDRAQPIDLDALAKLAAEATPGPWVAWAGHGWPIGIRDAMGWDAGSVPEGVWWPLRTSDATSDGPTFALLASSADQTFCAASREAVPALIARVRELEAERAAVRAEARAEMLAEVVRRLRFRADMFEQQGEDCAPEALALRTEADFFERHFAPAAGAGQTSEGVTALTGERAPHEPVHSCRSEAPTETGISLCAHEDCDLDPAPSGDGLCDAHERERDRESERFGTERKAQP